MLPPLLLLLMERKMEDINQTNAICFLRSMTAMFISNVKRASLILWQATQINAHDIVRAKTNQHRNYTNDK